MRLALYGGTFDPIHEGHLAVAREASARFQLDRVLFVVANVPWQKRDRNVTSAEDLIASL